MATYANLSKIKLGQHESNMLRFYADGKLHSFNTRCPLTRATARALQSHGLLNVHWDTTQATITPSGAYVASL